MRRNNFRYTFTATLVVILLFGTAAISTAQVQRVQMHIAGYLCGN
jgi:hypothetical protein